MLDTPELPASGVRVSARGSCWRRGSGSAVSGGPRAGQRHVRTRSGSASVHVIAASLCVNPARGAGVDETRLSQSFPFLAGKHMLS